MYTNTVRRMIEAHVQDVKQVNLQQREQSQFLRIAKQRNGNSKTKETRHF